jgi:hypothetical protein
MVINLARTITISMASLPTRLSEQLNQVVRAYPTKRCMGQLVQVLGEEQERSDDRPIPVGLIRSTKVSPMAFITQVTAVEPFANESDQCVWMTSSQSVMGQHRLTVQLSNLKHHRQQQYNVQ